MNLSEQITPSRVALDIKAKTREEVIEHLLSTLLETGKSFDRARVLAEILRREALGSTGVGYGVAIPHARVDGVHEMLVAFGRTRSGIDVEAIDKEPARLFFLVIGPKEDAGGYLQTMARISRLMRHNEIRMELLECKAEPQIQAIIRKYEP